jgi:hypothetical protein
MRRPIAGWRRAASSPEDHRRVEATIADSVPAFFVFPEWGAHDRAALRAWGLLAAIKTQPELLGIRSFRSAITPAVKRNA